MLPSGRRSPWCPVLQDLPKMEQWFTVGFYSVWDCSSQNTSKAEAKSWKCPGPVLKQLRLERFCGFPMLSLQSLRGKAWKNPYGSYGDHRPYSYSTGHLGVSLLVYIECTWYTPFSDCHGMSWWHLLQLSVFSVLLTRINNGHRKGSWHGKPTNSET